MLQQPPPRDQTSRSRAWSQIRFGQFAAILVNESGQGGLVVFARIIKTQVMPETSRSQTTSTRRPRMQARPPASEEYAR
jgi:hypothetical protein